MYQTISLPTNQHFKTTSFDDSFILGSFVNIKIINIQ